MSKMDRSMKQSITTPSDHWTLSQPHITFVPAVVLHQFPTTILASPPPSTLVTVPAVHNATVSVNPISSNVSFTDQTVSLVRLKRIKDFRMRRDVPTTFLLSNSPGCGALPDDFYIHSPSKYSCNFLYQMKIRPP